MIGNRMHRDQQEESFNMLATNFIYEYHYTTEIKLCYNFFLHTMEHLPKKPDVTFEWPKMPSKRCFVIY